MKKTRPGEGTWATYGVCGGRTGHRLPINMKEFGVTPQHSSDRLALPRQILKNTRTIYSKNSTERKKITLSRGTWDARENDPRERFSAPSPFLRLLLLCPSHPGQPGLWVFMSLFLSELSPGLMVWGRGGGGWVGKLRASINWCTCHPHLGLRRNRLCWGNMEKNQFYCIWGKKIFPVPHFPTMSPSGNVTRVTYMTNLKGLLFKGFIRSFISQGLNIKKNNNNRPNLVICFNHYLLIIKARVRNN